MFFMGSHGNLPTGEISEVLDFRAAQDEVRSQSEIMAAATQARDAHEEDNSCHQGIHVTPNCYPGLLAASSERLCMTITEEH